MNVKILFLFHPEMKRKKAQLTSIHYSTTLAAAIWTLLPLAGPPRDSSTMVGERKQKFLLSNSIRLFVWWLDIDDDALKCAETN